MQNQWLRLLCLCVCVCGPSMGRSPERHVFQKNAFWASTGSKVLLGLALPSRCLAPAGTRQPHRALELVVHKLKAASTCRRETHPVCHAMTTLSHQGDFLDDTESVPKIQLSTTLPKWPLSQAPHVHVLVLSADHLSQTGFTKGASAKERIKLGSIHSD